jgi:hypothetical protein
MVWILLISIAKEYILFALHLCPLCNYYIKGCRKLLTILIIWQEASHWMLISILPLVGNLYWKRVFNKQTMTAICYWYDKWLNFDMHPMEMMAWSEFCWSLLQRSMQEVSYYPHYLREGSTIVWQVCWFWHAIDGNDGTVQILLLSIWKEYILFALHPWPLCNYNNGYRKLLIMFILYDCFIFLEWRMDGFIMQPIKMVSMDSYHCSSLQLLHILCLLSIYWLDVSVREIWWKLCLILYMNTPVYRSVIMCDDRWWWSFATYCPLISPIVEMVGTNHTLNVVSFGKVYLLGIVDLV